MKPGRQYILSIPGLRSGEHSFAYTLGQDFFGTYPESQLQHPNLEADVQVEKRETMMVLSIRILGTVAAECDRCGQAFDLPLDQEHGLIVKYGEPQEDKEEDIHWIDPQETELVLDPWLYEFAHLSLPVRRVHPATPEGDPGCDPEILARLNDSQEQEKSDPRWDQLNSLTQES